MSPDAIAALLSVIGAALVLVWFSWHAWVTRVRRDDPDHSY